MGLLQGEQGGSGRRQGQRAPEGLEGQHRVWASPSGMWGLWKILNGRQIGCDFCLESIFLCAVYKPDHFRGKVGGREASWEAVVASRQEAMVGWAGEVLWRW